MKRIVLFIGIMLLASAVSIGAWTKLGTIGSYQGLSTETKPANAVTGSIYKCTDIFLIYEWDGTTWNINTVSAVGDTLTLTAPGNTAAIFVRGYKEVTWFFTIASINTKVNLGVQLKKGNGVWTTVDQDSLFYTANGNYGLEYNHIADSDSARFKFISEAGGTAALITQNYGLSGGN